MDVNEGRKSIFEGSRAVGRQKIIERDVQGFAKGFALQALAGITIYALNRSI